MSNNEALSKKQLSPEQFIKLASEKKLSSGKDYTICGPGLMTPLSIHVNDLGEEKKKRSFEEVKAMLGSIKGKLRLEATEEVIEDLKNSVYKKM